MIALLLAFQAACTPAAHAPTLDHAIVAVRDLEAAVGAFRAHGFRIKPGRLRMRAHGPRVRGVTLTASGARDVIRPVPTFWVRCRG